MNDAFWIALLIALPGTAASVIGLIVVVRVNKRLTRHIEAEDTITSLSTRVATAVKASIARAVPTD